MTDEEIKHFFEVIIAAGAIIAGFCSTFLLFRIQREAEFYRKPEILLPLGKQQFSSSFLLIILSALFALGSGIVLPLLYLVGCRFRFLWPRTVVGGLFASIAFLAGYFVDELLHYRIVSAYNKHDWRREAPIYVSAIVIGLAVLVVCIAFLG